MKKELWIWMPHPGHFICGSECRFRLNTCVGDFIVSTVGEYKPDPATLAVLKKAGDTYKHPQGWREIGFNRLYETMVFVAESHDDPIQCCPYRAAEWGEKDFAAYNTANDAMKGHMEMCEKWAERTLMGDEDDEGGGECMNAPDPLLLEVSYRLTDNTNEMAKKTIRHSLGAMGEHILWVSSWIERTLKNGMKKRSCEKEITIRMDSTKLREFIQNLEKPIQ